MLLAVINHGSQCNVSIADAPGSIMNPQTACVADGEVFLQAVPIPGFEPGEWWGTSADAGSGDAGTLNGITFSTTVVVSGKGTYCVSVCCPVAGSDGGAGLGCPGKNECPGS